MRDRKPTLILPVESQVRELDAKLLLACVAAERGYLSILGYRADIDAELVRFPRGTYLSKSMTRRSMKVFRNLQDLGHEIGTWDEEALVYPSIEYYFQSRMSATAMEYLSFLLAWGNDNAEVFRKYPGYAGTPIHVVGNPRIDLLRRELRGFFDEDVRPIRERYGKFLLVNTNFSLVNSPIYRVRTKRDDDRSPEERQRKKAMGDGYSALKLAIFDGFREMVPVLAAAFPDHRVIVRPHPSELHGPWETLAKECGNVQVVSGGNVIPWLLAADVLIHNGCTTAIEAFALGRPSIAYRPVTSAAWDHDVPNTLSHECARLDALHSLVSRAVQGELDRTPTAEQSRLFDEYVVGLSGRLASDRVVDALDSRGAQRGELRRPPFATYLRGRLAARKRKAKRQRAEQQQGKLEARHEDRFPVVSVDALRQRVDRLDRSLGRFSGIRIEPVAEKIFRIEA